MPTLERPAHLKQEAERLLEQADAGRALSLLEPVLDQAPDDPEGHALIGIAYMMSGDHTRGLGHLERSVEIEPYESLYRSNLGYAYQYLGRIPEAIEAYQVAVDLNPHSDRARAALEALTGSAYVPQPEPDRNLFGDSLAEPAMMRSTDDHQQISDRTASSSHPESDESPGLMTDFWGARLVDSEPDPGEVPTAASDHFAGAVASQDPVRDSSGVSDGPIDVMNATDIPGGAQPREIPPPPSPPAWVSVRVGSTVSVVSGQSIEPALSAEVEHEERASQEDLPTSESGPSLNSSNEQSPAQANSIEVSGVGMDSHELPGLVEDSMMRNGSSTPAPEAPDVSLVMAAEQAGKGAGPLSGDAGAAAQPDASSGNEPLALVAAAQEGAPVQEGASAPGIRLEEAVDHMPGVLGPLILAPSSSDTSLPKWDGDGSSSEPVNNVVEIVEPQYDTTHSVVQSDSGSTAQSASVATAIAGSMGDEAPVNTDTTALDHVVEPAQGSSPIPSAYQGGLRGCRPVLAKPSVPVSRNDAGGVGVRRVSPLILLILVCLALCAGSYGLARHFMAHHRANAAQAHAARPVAALPARTH